MPSRDFFMTGEYVQKAVFERAVEETLKKGQEVQVYMVPAILKHCEQRDERVMPHRSEEANGVLYQISGISNAVTGSALDRIAQSIDERIEDSIPQVIPVVNRPSTALKHVLHEMGASKVYFEKNDLTCNQFYLLKSIYEQGLSHMFPSSGKDDGNIILVEPESGAKRQEFFISNL